MNRFHRMGATALLIGAAVVAQSQSRIPETRVVTASNTTANTLLVYDTSDSGCKEKHQNQGQHP